jgi:alanyl-tRNA synthetase
MRRIEASTGRAAEAELGERMRILKELSTRFQTNFRDIPERIIQFEDSIVNLKKELRDSESKTRLNGVEELTGDVNEFNGRHLLVTTTNFSSKELREIADHLRVRYPSCVLILATVEGEKAAVLVAVTPDLVDLGLSARDVTSKLTELTDGKGGGRPELAQAGGCDPARLENALSQIKDDIEAQLESLAK